MGEERIDEDPAAGSQETSSRRPARPACPSCGSAHTQPFLHAGPAARVNMKCLDCGTLFRHRAPRD